MTEKKHRDPQRAVPVHQCTRCGGELYPGCLCWRLGGGFLCRDCAGAWALEELSPFRLVCGEVRR